MVLDVLFDINVRFLAYKSSLFCIFIHLYGMNVKEYLLTTDEISLGAIARKMWPNNKDAKTYLGKKLSGERPFTEKDAEKARKALHDLGHKLIGLT